jgi:hypothetical protein
LRFLSRVETVLYFVCSGFHDTTLESWEQTRKTISNKALALKYVPLPVILHSRTPFSTPKIHLGMRKFVCEQAMDSLVVKLRDGDE